MRALIAREKGDGDPWDLKLVSGGMIDIEFIAQYLTLSHAARHPDLPDTDVIATLGNAMRLELIGRDAGEALYGPRWQTDLARDLQASEHLVRQWVSGVDDVPRKIELDLLRLCMERANAVNGILKRLKHVATQVG